MSGEAPPPPQGEGEGEAAAAAALQGAVRDASSSAGFSEAEKREPSARVLALADQIEELNLIEVADLTKLIKERLGLPDAPAMPAGMMMPMMAKIIEVTMPNSQHFEAYRWEVLTSMKRKKLTL